MKCIHCLNPIVPKQRYTKLNLKTCLECGDSKAHLVRHTIAPINKSNYYYIHSPEMLKQLNPKRTT